MAESAKTIQKRRPKRTTHKFTGFFRSLFNPGG
jgi:hypothetical protein